MSTRTLICGGGVNGAAIAYLRSRRGVETIFIDRPRLACAGIRGLRPFDPGRFPLRDPKRANQEPDHRMRGTFD